MANDLLIQINADAKNAQKAFDDVKAQTQDLETQLSKVANVSAIAFAALTATVGVSIAKYIDAKKATDELTQALQNQGIFTEDLRDQYLDYADAIEAATGADGDAITSALASTQAMIGQTTISKELTQAVVDYAAATKKDLGSAFEEVAKGINGNVGGFKKLGIELDENASKSERAAALQQVLAQRYGGQALAADQAAGGTGRLTQAFDKVFESLGERFFPIFSKLTGALTSFFTFITSNPALVDLAAAFIAAGIAVTGIVTALAIAIPAFTAVQAAVAALGISMNVAFAGIPLLIGAVVAAATFLALNWEKSMAAVKAAAAGMVTFVSEAFSGLGKIVSGVQYLSGDRIKEGLAQIKGSFAAAKEETVKTYNEITDAQKVALDTQDQDKAKAAAAIAAKERAAKAELQAIQTEQNELLRLQNENASAELIALKTREIETLKALQATKNAEEDALLQERLTILREQQTQLEAEELQRIQDFATVKGELETQLADQASANAGQISAARTAQLQAQLKTEKDIDRQVQEEMLKKRIEIRNQELLDRKKYGEAVAIINKALATEEVQGVRTAAGELIALQNSKNSTLKSIGKAAAVAQITIDTAKSAMSIYQGFATIPIIGPALGVAGAAAAIAFGGERISQVTSAADGGLIEGGIPGVDSVPAMLMPGELVVPRRNFDDVVGAVQGKTGGGNDAMLEEIKKLNEMVKVPQQNNFYGDMISDDTFVDRFVNKISDAIEFRNAKIVGVNA